MLLCQQTLAMRKVAYSRRLAVHEFALFICTLLFYEFCSVGDFTTPLWKSANCIALCVALGAGSCGHSDTSLNHLYLRRRDRTRMPSIAASSYPKKTI